MMLSPYERETIITFNEEESFADVYTYNPSLKKRLEEFTEEFPEDFILLKANEFGGMTWRISKKLIRIRKPYSEERKERDRQTALRSGRRPPKR